VTRKAFKNKSKFNLLEVKLMAK